jgi:DNA polymerase-1
MPDIIYTDEIDEKWMEHADADIVAQTYNGLDCCVTAEIFSKLFSQLNDEPECVRTTYNSSLAKQGPIMEMGLTGILLDMNARAKTLIQLEQQEKKVKQNFDWICQEVFGCVFNIKSPLQMKNLFYGILGLKEVRKRNTNGQFTATVNRDALESFRYLMNAEIYANHVLELRDLAKKIGFLRTEIDDDKRIRTKYNIAGTNTGRLSSSASVFDTGTNLQNIDTTLRDPFVPDPGEYFVNIDLEQADARNLGAKIWNIFHEDFGPEAAGKYLDACESGDLHTRVCSMAWTELDWPEPFEIKPAKKIASQNFYRDMSYRDAAKRLGHGTNFYGTPKTMAMHTKTAVSLIESFQRSYFSAFPLIGSYDKDPDAINWHNWVRNELLTKGYLTTPFGRRRYFFDRAKSDQTLRGAIAYEPQSMTAHEIDAAMVRVWEELPIARCMAQVHDSVLFSIPYVQRDIIIPQLLELMQIPLTLVGGRKLIVPVEAKCGWNWGDVVYNRDGKPAGNLHGLSEWKGSETRTPPSPKKRLKDYLK